MALRKRLPPQKQLDFLDWEFGVFLHFGIRTFHPGHRDWDMAPMPADRFQPEALDCRQWTRIIREAGARYAILVCKHHDGFANWPSAHTEYSVAATPWKNGKGDVVREFVEACRADQLKVGLYYSPAEFAMKTEQRTDREYDDYFIAQIGELLTNYGKIDYLWFDACGSEGHKYDEARIIAEIRRMQPDILIFNLWDQDTRWVGNESGLSHMPCFNVVDAIDFSIQTGEQDRLSEARFLPVECDFRMRLENWFWAPDDVDTVKSVEELMGLYDYSVGRGANFLVNIGPDPRGLLPDADAKSLLDFGEALRKRFSNKIAGFGQFQQAEGAWTCSFEQSELIDHLVAMEDLTGGESIRRYQVEVSPFPYGKPITVYEGHQVGHKAICHFPPVRAKAVTFRITEQDGNAVLRDLSLYKA